MRYTKLVKLGADLIGKLGKQSSYDCFVAACADYVLSTALSENSIDTVYEYGLTCTCLSREYIEMSVQRYYSFLYNCQILYIDFL